MTQSDDPYSTPTDALVWTANVLMSEVGDPVLAAESMFVKWSADVGARSAGSLSSSAVYTVTQVRDLLRAVHEEGTALASRQTALAAQVLARLAQVMDTTPEQALSAAREAFPLPPEGGADA